MKNFNFTLSSLLLTILVVPVIMTYRIYPGDTNYIQFGLIFLGLLTILLLDLFKHTSKKYFLYKSIIFWTVLFLSVGGAFISAIIVRHQVAPVYQIHDITLQLEAAIRFFLDGVNPWAATYHNTFMAAWNYGSTENPALYHFVMMPFYLLFALPFYYFSNHTIGFFDGRIPLFILYFSLLIMTFRFAKDNEHKFLFTTLMALNPAMFLYTLEGRSDVYMFAFLFGSLIFLNKKLYIPSGILLGLAFLVKQSVWPILPLYVYYLYLVSHDFKKTLNRALPFFVTFLVILMPFLLWNPSAFINSTIFYLSGNTTHSYPVSGYGLGMLLHQLGIIKSVGDQYPFIIWQIIFVTPAIIFCLWIIRKYPSVKTLIITYGVLAFIYWYMSRYFNNSHMGYLTMVFITAYFWPENARKTIQQ